MHAAAERRRAGKICHAAAPRALTPVWKFEIKNKVLNFDYMQHISEFKKIGTYAEEFLISSAHVWLSRSYYL